MTAVEKDKAYIEAGIPELEDYLLSNELYWPISSHRSSLPRLTIGGVLLAKARLEARGEWIGSLVMELDRIRGKWRVAWEKKAGREFDSRMRLWGNYLTDYIHSPENHADAYEYEIRYRVMLQLLLAELSSQHGEQEALSQLDQMLRAQFLPSDFIWDPDLAGGFPREVYWYLYGKPSD